MEQQVKVSQEQQFNEVVLIIQQHRSKASQAINQEVFAHCLAYWWIRVGKTEKRRMGSKSSESALRIHSIHTIHEIKGYSRSSIYNMDNALR